MSAGPGCKGRCAPLARLQLPRLTPVPLPCSLVQSPASGGRPRHWRTPVSDTQHHTFRPRVLPFACPSRVHAFSITRGGALCARRAQGPQGLGGLRAPHGGPPTVRRRHVPGGPPHPHFLSANGTDAEKGRPVRGAPGTRATQRDGLEIVLHDPRPRVLPPPPGESTRHHLQVASPLPLAAGPVPAARWRDGAQFIPGPTPAS